MSVTRAIRRLLGLPVPRRRRARARPRAVYSSLSVQLVVLVQLTVVGGVAFASGFLGFAALRALGWPVALAALAAGGLLGAIGALVWLRQRPDGRREALARLHA